MPTGGIGPDRLHNHIIASLEGFATKRLDYLRFSFVKGCIHPCRRGRYWLRGPL